VRLDLVAGFGFEVGNKAEREGNSGSESEGETRMSLSSVICESSQTRESSCSDPLSNGVGVFTVEWKDKDDRGDDEKASSVSLLALTFPSGVLELKSADDEMEIGVLYADNSETLGSGVLWRRPGLLEKKWSKVLLILALLV
jgi:hypothetical protein